MAGPNLSFYTPTQAGTVPQASLGTSFVPALSAGILQAAKTYQAVKSVDKAAQDAAALFNDPTYAQVFRSMGMAAIQQGESPTPIINSMLSTAITLKRDEQQMAQRERMMNLQFGQQMQLENLRTANNLTELQTRNQLQSEYMSPGNIGAREQAQTIGRLSGAATFQQSEMGQQAMQNQMQADEQKRAADIEKAAATARETERAKLGVRQEFGVLPDEEGSSASNSLFEDAGIDPLAPIGGMDYSQLEDLEMNLLTTMEASPEAKRQLTPRLQAVRRQKSILDEGDPDTQKKLRKQGSTGPNISDRANRYISP